MNTRDRTIISGILVSLCGIVGGCTSTPIPPTYTQVEEQAICERKGGWWHPDNISGQGFCEYQSPGTPQTR
jgi:hypothetical protein